jgi:RNA polymerase sigma factor (sigma-70 family)
MELSDEALVLACRTGDANAWETLVRRYQRLVYSVPRRAGLDADLAAEVFQRVFVRLVEHINRLERPERISAWLVTTARRESWRVSRSQRVTSPLPDETEEEDETAGIPDNALLPDDLILRLEQQHTIRRAVAGLDERCRTLLTLLFYRAEPPPYAEIAAILGTSEGSIGPTRARCLQKLRKTLEEMGV